MQKRGGKNVGGWKIAIASNASFDVSLSLNLTTLLEIVSKPEWLWVTFK